MNSHSSFIISFFFYYSNVEAKTKKLFVPGTTRPTLILGVDPSFFPRSVTPILFINK